MGADQVPSRERYVDAVFGERGILAGTFAGYRPRPGQVALARAVDDAIAGRKHLMAEGPTGTGKSLAYAVPATYYAATTGQTVVIVTANIALQEQLVEKDLPLLKRVLPWGFSFALMKGRNNYLCLDRLDDYEARTASLFSSHRDHGGESAEERRQLPIVYEWARASREGADERGDVSELPFEPAPSVWRRFSVTSDDCKRDRCEHAAECFANRASEEARQAMVVVTNYHMLCANLAVYGETAQDLVLPPFDVCIMDEAHKAADIARDFFGSRITMEGTKRVARKLRDSHPAAVDRHERAATLFFSLMGNLRRDRDRYKARLRGAYTADEMRSWGDLSNSLAMTRDHLVKLVAEAELVFDDAMHSFGPDDRETKKAKRNLGDLERDLRRSVEILKSLTGAMNPAVKGAREVHFVDEDEKGRITIASRLVYARDVLGPLLYGHTKNRRDTDTRELVVGSPTAVIATSATLATDGGSFAYAAEELGCPDGYGELVAQSPFEWERQCLFVVPEGLPLPNDESFADAVARATERACELAGGRTLGLYTSRRVLNHVYDRLVPTIGRKYTLLKQGDAPKTKLIDRFKTDVTSVLLGNESFWAGVDVPGESLSCVVIDRLPFPTPDDPVLDAISVEDDKWFFRYSVPRAIIAFKQGFGRLIRSLECRGVVVCLDRRIIDKRYGKQFLRALPPVPKSMRIESIGEFLNPPPPMAAGWDDP